jgi:hypothetical protein
MPLIQWIMQNLDVPEDIGGVVMGGSGVSFRILNPGVSGGAVLSGSADPTRFFEEITAGGARVGGMALRSLPTIFAEGGVRIGSNAGAAGAVVVTTYVVNAGQATGGVKVGSGFGLPGAIVVYNPGAIIPNCDKAELPRHPKPSTADYRPANIGPLMDFFIPVVSLVTGTQQTTGTVIFRYENNTPCRPKDDIFVSHPNVTSTPYVHLHTVPKSQALKDYEERAKKSKRLRDFEAASPAGITYFQDIQAYGADN